MQDRLSEAEGKEFDFLQTSLIARRRSWKTKEQTEKYIERERGSYRGNKPG
jgi:hypothetical protein